MPSEPGLVLRNARPEDGEAVAAMCRALSLHEGETAPVLSAAAFRRDGFGGRRAFRCLVAERAGRPRGYALHVDDYDTDLMCHSTYVADLYVDNGARRCGIGRALMATVAAVTRRRGGATLHWNVLRGNESARAFYRTLGRELGDVVVYSAEGAAFAALAATPSPAGMVLRRAEADDAPAVAALLAGLLAHEGIAHPELDLAERILADGFGAAPAFTCHIAVLDGAVQGFALHWPSYDTVPGVRGVYLSDLYVAEGARRGGVARALLAATARHGAEAGARYLEWEARRDNANARALYDRVGTAYPEVLPMIAAGADFDALAAEGVAPA